MSPTTKKYLNVMVACLAFLLAQPYGIAELTLNLRLSAGLKLTHAFAARQHQ